MANKPFGPRAIHNGVLLVEAFGKVSKAKIATKAAYDPENLRLKA